MRIVENKMVWFVKKDLTFKNTPHADFESFHFVSKFEGDTFVQVGLKGTLQSTNF